MDIENTWNIFLEKIKFKVQSIIYETWFKETKLISLVDNKALIKVPLDLHKNHLKEHYSDIIKETFFEITSNIIDFDFISEGEIIKEEIKIKENNEAIFDSGLDPNYTFDTFVTGESNKFAKAIGVAVAEKPGSMYNPLFIYGNSGLGKTHLMNAIGNYIVNNSSKRVRYVTSDTFVSDFLKLYRNKNENNFKAVDNFKQKYRDLDVLIIDDIQYLEIASKTQQEFFNTFNELHQKNKQIIISSDRSPDDLKKLEDNLKTRFNWGLTIDILPPEFELRIAILNKKIEARAMNEIIPEEVKEYIAANCQSDVRKLEGALTRVIAYATIMNSHNIDIDLAIEALGDFIGKNIISKNKIDKVIKLVADKYNLTAEDIKGKKRLSTIALPRQIAMYICREYLEESLPKIGSEFGGKDHTTVMHAVNKIKKMVEKDKTLEKEIEKIVREVK